jgi:hypothetical protein
MAHFEADTLTMLSSAGPHGTIAPAERVRLEFGSPQKFVMLPAKGYRINSLVVDAKSQEIRTSYRFREISLDHTIMIVFRISNQKRVVLHRQIQIRVSMAEGDIRMNEGGESV